MGGPVSGGWVAIISNASLCSSLIAYTSVSLSSSCKDGAGIVCNKSTYPSTLSVLWYTDVFLLYFYAVYDINYYDVGAAPWWYLLIIAPIFAGL